MTYEELFSLFKERNKSIATCIEDYRPANGAYCIQVWTKGGGMFYAKWFPIEDMFLITNANEGAE